MADPWGIVVVPAEGDPGGLLADGLCGARPPIAHAVAGAIAAGWKTDIEGVWFEGPAPRLREGMPRVQGLPLRWEGALVPEGWDRARRVYREAIRASGGTPTGAAQLDCPPWARVAEYASWMVLWHPPLASRVVLLDLVDGRLVERQP